MRRQRQRRVRRRMRSHGIVIVHVIRRRVAGGGATTDLRMVNVFVSNTAAATHQSRHHGVFVFVGRVVVQLQ